MALKAHNIYKFFTRSGKSRQSLAFFLFLSSFASATVTISATFKNPAGQPVPFAYLTFDLENCGFYIPSTVGQTVTMVQKHLQLRQNQLPAAIYGNN